MMFKFIRHIKETGFLGPVTGVTIARAQGCSQVKERPPLPLPPKKKRAIKSKKKKKKKKYTETASFGKEIILTLVLAFYHGLDRPSCSNYTRHSS